MSTVKAGYTTWSQKLSSENLDLAKAKDVQHLEGFCGDEVGRLSSLGVSYEIFETHQVWLKSQLLTGCRRIS
jgi:hypothetical protein